MKFVALDFEKANRYSHSICSVGLAVFEDSQIIEEKHILVQPPKNKFELSHIHNIHPEDTKEAPLFGEIWKDIESYFTDLPLVAHNALSVESAYITKALNFYNLEVPEMNFVCTMNLAKRFFSYVPNYSLAHICKILNIEFNESMHHDALYDAKKAGEVLIRMKESFLIDDNFTPMYITSTPRRSTRREKKIPTEFIKPKLDVEDKSHFFFGKKVVITGSFIAFPDRSKMAKMIYEVGGDNNTSISKLTDLVIIGQKPGPAKMRTIQELGIKTMTENEFLKLFENEK